MTLLEQVSKNPPYLLKTDLFLDMNVFETLEVIIISYL